ncbi:hypothetical protein MN869_09505 [Acinetobacter sp. NIPH1876]|uniref:hypothetical protein n=1 Tax=Acinetobacter sp. NIPH1876 TaxID=2924041 RepID=UPI001FAE2092|nr:hypothetical protein [Acinetobacter sp. NIPH1876]MCJ0828682.1 hypothetical protein [Acinetobacter sp. NIPH1876]
MSIKSEAPKGATHIYQDHSFNTNYCFYCEELEEWLAHDKFDESWKTKDLSSFLIEEI